MKRIITVLIGMTLVALVISGCGSSVSIEDVTTALEAKDADQVVEIITSYQEQSNKSELDEAVVDYFKILGKSKDYADFLFMEEVINKTPDESLRDKLQTSFDKNSDSRVVAFLSGSWVRRDYTDADGMIIDVKWAEDGGTAIITGVDVKDNYNGFQEGDVKWKNAKVLSNDEISYEDLFKFEDSSTEYYPAYSKVDYKKNQIVCHITADNADDYSRGTKQVWIKESALNKEKEVLTDEDFIIDGKTYGKDWDSYQFFYVTDYVNDNELKEQIEAYLKEQGQKEDERLKTNRDFDNGDTREDIIQSFGYGRTMFETYKEDVFYNATKDSDDLITKGFANTIREKEYHVLYFDKNKKRFIQMYFNEDDTLIAFIIAQGYGEH